MEPEWPLADTPPADAPPAGAPPAETAPAAPIGTGTARRLGTGATVAASAAAEWVARPRVRLSLTGMVLLAAGALLTNSVWTLPLVIAGALMVGVAWVGHRLEGRLSLEWGPAGAQLAFRATIRSPARAGARESLPAVAAQLDGQVIESDAHTVEIDVAELEALIAAADGGDADAMQVTRRAQAHDAA
ncbi:MAG: hypothetical protein ACRDMJ_03730 [Solirubrobacteraceae bacterium]